MPSEDDLQGELLSSLDARNEAVPSQHVLTVDDLNSLTWDRFESLIALIESKYGRKVWLSPKCGDGGVDVISQCGSQVRLIQCKHTEWTNSVEKQVLEELISSCDAFRTSLQVAGFTFKPVLITNSSVPRSAKEFGFKRDVEVIAIDSFRSYLGNMNCTKAEVEAMEHRRCSTLPRLKQDLTAHLRTV